MSINLLILNARFCFTFGFTSASSAALPRSICDVISFFRSGFVGMSVKSSVSLHLSRMMTTLLTQSSAVHPLQPRSAIETDLAYLLGCFLLFLLNRKLLTFFLYGFQRDFGTHEQEFLSQFISE